MHISKTQLAISFIWTLLVLLLLAILSPRLPSTRGRHATIHPGLAVGVELILTIGLVLSALLMTTIAAYDYLDLGYDPASTSTSTSEVTASALQTSILALAACAILCITALLHFTLFVLACIDTDTHRRARRRADDDVNAQLIARRIVDEMAERGEIIRAPLLVGAEEGGWTGERDGGGVTGAEAGAGAGRAEEALMGRPLVNTTHHRERGDERETAPFLAAEHEGGEIGRAL